MHILGHTLKEITFQKVGIVHEHNPLLMYKQNEEIMGVVSEWVKEDDSKLYLIREDKEKALFGNTPEFNKLPDFQKRNWLLAYIAYRFVRDRDSLKDLGSLELITSQQIQVPARMDISYKKGHRVIMDGAHNYQKMAAFISSYKHMFAGQKAAVLLAFKNDKAYAEALPLIKDIASEIIVTTFKTSQDLPVESCSPEDITQALKKIDASNVSVITDNLEAFKKLLKSKTKNVIITGSFYLIAQIREGLK
jgi:dihydrofolate synthase/folylpolyglutamate synthase